MFHTQVLSVFLQTNNQTKKTEMLRRSFNFLTKEKLKIIECPRDAMQGLHKFVPTEQKIRYHTSLLKVGYDTLDCVSFVPPKAVPQLRDSEEVLAKIGPLVRDPHNPNAATEQADRFNTKLLAVVANVRGCVKACKEPSLTYIGYPLSASETFQQKNTNRGIDEALKDLEEIQKFCVQEKKQLVTYISMAFGNPYREPFEPEMVQKLVERVVGLGCKIVSLADTKGSGTPELITSVYKTTMSNLPSDVECGLHLHSTAQEAYTKVLAAINAGCRRFDGAIAGMGGCPFAGDGLVGNIPTETIVEAANKLGLDHGLNVDALAEAKEVLHQVWGTSVKELFISAVLENEKMFFDLCVSTFTEHDTNNVGYLNYDQFVDAMKNAYEQLGENSVPAEKLKQKFVEMDLNHDNRITFDEFMFFTRKALARRLKKYYEEH
jgi:hydroxymethylglutaryl-CoA lyase